MSEISLHTQDATDVAVPQITGPGLRTGIRRGDVIHHVTDGGDRLQTYRVTAMSGTNEPWRLYLIDHLNSYISIGRDVAGNYATDDGQRLDTPVQIARTSYVLRNARILLGKSTYRTDGVGGHILDISLDKLNPWVIISTGSTLLRLTPETMNGWAMKGRKSVPLIEAVYGTTHAPRDTVSGLLIRHTSMNIYAAVQRLNTSSHTSSLWMLDGSDVWQHLDIRSADDWQVVGTKKTFSDLMTRTKDTGLAVSTKAPLTASYLEGSKYGTRVAGGLVAFFGLVPLIVGDLQALPIMAAVAVLPPVAQRVWEHQRTRGVFHGQGEQSVIPVLSASSSVGSGLVNRLREQLHTDLPSVHKEIITRILGTGSYLLTHLDTLDAPVRSEVTELLMDHLPKALKLYGMTAEHQLSPSAQVEASELLGRQLSQIDTALDRTRAQIESQVMRQVREHANFLDAKLRGSDLD